MLAYPPIRDYALIGDCHGAALVSRDGSVDWCCFHRFDARPVFARVLDWARGGFCRLAPTGRYTSTRRYLPGTNILETTFETGSGRLVVLDCLPVHPSSDPTVAEAVHCEHRLIRMARCEGGEVEVELELCPRFDYGRTIPRIEEREAGILVVYGGADSLVVQTSAPGVQHDVADWRSVVRLRNGERTFAVLTYVLPHALRIHRHTAEDVLTQLDNTRRFWEDWSARCTYEGPHRDTVLRSALVLKALTNAPTGAVVAAPTTSLPEEIGGVRNWDYRFTWLRDAALTVYALFTMGYTDEAHSFVRWLIRTTAGRAEDLQVLYGVGGERLVPEILLEDLDGHRGSRPVRIGNAAAEQLQLDAYGYLVDTAWLYHKHGGAIDATFWEFVTGVIDTVAKRWVERDAGIWEVRGPARHFVSSKVLAWVAVDRAIRLARARGLPADLGRWVALRRTIRSAVEREGVDPATGVFVQAYGSTELDASTLLIPLLHFLPAHDPRVRRTTARIADELTHDGLVYRYLDRAHDGLPGGEGTFVICTCWLVENLALAGETERAAALFARLLGLVNDVGLLAEQVDAASGELLGNFPQGFSHVGLIGAAITLARAGAPRAAGAATRSASAAGPRRGYSTP